MDFGPTSPHPRNPIRRSFVRPMPPSGANALLEGEKKGTTGTMAKTGSKQMKRRGESSLSTATEREAGGALPKGSKTDASVREFTDPAPQHLGPTLLRVAWLAILLGLAMEGLLLLLSGGFGELLGLRSAVADLVKNVT